MDAFVKLYEARISLLPTMFMAQNGVRSATSFVPCYTDTKCLNVGVLHQISVQQTFQM